MTNLFLKRKKMHYIVLIGVVVLALSVMVIINVKSQSVQKLSTPDLIKQAFTSGEITEEERLLYLAYALDDQDKLPTRFHSSVPWGGTLIIWELREAVRSKSIMCKLSPFGQSELRRILQEGVICDT